MRIVTMVFSFCVAVDATACSWSWSSARCQPWAECRFAWKAQIAPQPSVGTCILRMPHMRTSSPISEGDAVYANTTNATAEEEGDAVSAGWYSALADAFGSLGRSAADAEAADDAKGEEAAVPSALTAMEEAKATAAAAVEAAAAAVASAEAAMAAVDAAVDEVAKQAEAVSADDDAWGPFGLVGLVATSSVQMAIKPLVMLGDAEASLAAVAGPIPVALLIAALCASHAGCSNAVTTKQPPTPVPPASTPVTNPLLARARSLSLALPARLFGIAWNVWEALTCGGEAPAEEAPAEEEAPPPKNGAASPSAKAVGGKSASDAKKASPATSSRKPKIGALLAKEEAAPDYALTGNGESASSKSKSRKKKKSQKVDN